MLLNIVNPSAEIREGYVSYNIATEDGRSLLGVLIDQDKNVVVIRGADGKDVSIPRGEIEEMKPSKASIMPEGLLRSMSEQQIRDLFAYLRTTQPLID
jgi:putative heme-binding domain-containing protein